MLCQFDKLLYPKEGDTSTVAYMIAVYRPCEILRDSDGDMMSQFRAVGYCLPTAQKLRYQLNGHWVRHPKHGVQFEVESYEEVISHTREGIIAYLSSGQIKGVGPKIAEKIYDAFGQDTLEVLDQEPEKLMSVRGISEKKLLKIRDSYVASRGARDVIAFLAPHGVTAHRAIQLYHEYGEDTLNIVRNHPYRLVELTGIAFKTADKMALSLGIQPVSPERVDGALMYTLTEAEGQGHLCLEKHDFIRRCLMLLETSEITEDMAAARAFRLVQENRLTCYGEYVYRSQVATMEHNIAFHIVQQLQCSVESYEQLELAISGEERSTIHKVEGFDPVPLAVEYIDLTTQEKRKRLPVMAQLAWFRLKYPEGKIALTVEAAKDYFVAAARVYVSYKDPADCFLAEATASRKYDPLKPTVSPREWAQTAAVGIALRNAGFGLQFGAAGDDFETQAPDKLGAGNGMLPASSLPTQPEPVPPDCQTEIGNQEESPAPAIPLTPEQQFEHACAVVSPIKKHSGKTLGEILTLEPRAINWLATKYTGDEQIKAAAEFICTYAQQATV